MFNPASPDGKLAKMITAKEAELKKDLSWSVKVLEKPGVPLINCLGTKFPIETGCPLKPKCKACSRGNGITCAAKNLVYQVECGICKHDESEKKRKKEKRRQKNKDGLNREETKEEKSGIHSSQTAKRENFYIGETARTLRCRAAEHINKLREWDRDSFMLNHWAKEHGHLTQPPNLKFTVVKQCRDALSRQIQEALWIPLKGTMNMRNEFGVNELCRIQMEKSQHQLNEDLLESKNERQKDRDDLKNFVTIIKSVITRENKRCNEEIINLTVSNCKSNSKRKPLEPKSLSPKKKSRMEHSTPKENSRHPNRYREAVEQHSPIEISVGNINALNQSPSLIPEISDPSQDEINTTRANTNLSDNVLGLDIEHTRHRLGDSSLEYSIDARCLEETARRGGIIQMSQNEIETLRDLAILFEEVGVADWTSNCSFPNSISSQECISSVMEEAGVADWTSGESFSVSESNDEGVDKEEKQTAREDTTNSNLAGGDLSSDTRPKRVTQLDVQRDLVWIQ